MRTSRILLLLLLILISGCKSNYYATNFRKDAIELILASEQIRQFSHNLKDYRVSEELIPFHEIGFLFKDYLPQEKFPPEDFSDFSNYEIGINRRLSRLSSDKSSFLQFFFSKKVDKFFIVEAFCEEKRKMKRLEIPDTGQSVAFLFEINGGELNVVASQVIDYG